MVKCAPSRGARVAQIYYSGVCARSAQIPK